MFSFKHYIIKLHNYIERQKSLFVERNKRKLFYFCTKINQTLRVSFMSQALCKSVYYYANFQHCLFRPIYFLFWDRNRIGKSTIPEVVAEGAADTGEAEEAFGLKSTASSATIGRARTKSRPCDRSHVIVGIKRSATSAMIECDNRGTVARNFIDVWRLLNNSLLVDFVISV